MRASHRLITAAVLAGAILVATPVAQPASSLRVITAERASGSRVIVVAAGSVSRPTSLVLKVTSQPRQRVRGQWLVTCQRGRSSRSKRGTFSGRTPLRRTLPMPFSKPRRCRVSATAQLSSSGRVRLALLHR